MRTLVFKLLGVALLAGMAGAAQAVPVVMTFTGDNVVDFQINCADPACTQSIPSGGLGEDPSYAAMWWMASTTTVDLEPGDYYATFGVVDQGGAAGFIAEILSGSQLYQSGDGWESCVITAFGCTGLFAQWQPAFDLGAYGVEPWRVRVINHDFTGANWLWSDADNVNVDVARFRVGFTVAAAAIPEPGTLALFGLGLVGMGMTRRKKKV